MKTSDGIPSADWEYVEVCAEEIVAASANDLDCSLLMSNMRKLLNRLRDRYGRLPSILATEADYVEDPQLELSLLKEAYISACEINDEKNIAFISASLAEFYLESEVHINKAEFWVLKLKGALELFPDSYLSTVLSDVTEEIRVKKCIQQKNETGGVSI